MKQFAFINELKRVGAEVGLPLTVVTKRSGIRLETAAGCHALGPDQRREMDKRQLNRCVEKLGMQGVSL
jgi:hypothetical protein